MTRMVGVGGGVGEVVVREVRRAVVGVLSYLSLLVRGAWMSVFAF
jgi:hypothetical protein